MEVVFFIQSETNPYLCTECIELLYSLIRKSDTTEIPKGFLQNLYILKEKLAKDMYSLNILQEIEAHYRIRRSFSAKEADTISNVTDRGCDGKAFLFNQRINYQFDYYITT